MNIYLDYAAATPVREEVIKVMRPYHSTLFANASSMHLSGRKVNDVLELSRETVRRLLHASVNDKIIFTSGGTESINLALQGAAFSLQLKGKHIITTTIEHKAVLETCAFLERHGFSVTYVPVQKNGIVSVRDVESAIRDDTILISVMYANNEIGTIQLISKIGEIARKKGIVFHTDACQAGSLELDIHRLHIDLMTLNSNKMYGPKGVGLLYVREGIVLQPLLYGGGQEFGLRPGTENVAGMVGFTYALGLMQQEREKENKRLERLRDLLWKGIRQKISDTFVNGDMTHRLTSNLNVRFTGIDAETLLLYLSEKGIMVSSGSACTSGAIEPSHVLTALGLTSEEAQEAIRFSLGKYTTEKEIRYVLQVLPAIVESLRKVT